MSESKPDQSLDKGVKAPNVSEMPKEEMEAPVHTEKHPILINRETHGLRDDIDVNTPISDVKGPNVFERVKEELEAIAEAIHPHKQDKVQDSSPKDERDGDKCSESDHERRSSHGDEKHPMHTNRETHGLREDIDVNTPISNVKGPNVFERVKEELEAIAGTIHPHKQDKIQDSSPKDEKDDAKFTGLNHEGRSSLAEEAKAETPTAGHRKETHGKGDDIDVSIPVSEFRGPSIFHRAKEEIEAIVDSIHHKKESESPKKESGFRARIGKRLERILTPKTHKSPNRD